MKSILNTKTWSALLALVLLGLVGVLGTEAWQDREARLASARTETERTALILEEGVNAILQRSDIMLAHIADDLTRYGKPSLRSAAVLHPYLETLNADFPELTNFRVLKADGCTLAAAVEEEYGQCYGDRAYFQRLRANPAAGLDISEPVLGKSSRQWQIMLSRRASTPDGGFAGVVNAGLTLSTLERLFQSVHLGAGSSIALLDKDFRVVARYPLEEGQRFQSAASGPVWAAMQANPLAGTAEGVSPVDGKDRLYSYRRVGNYPLYLVVGIARDEALADWRISAQLEAAVAAALLLTVVVLSLLILRRYRMEQEGRQRLRDIIATFGEGLYVTDARGRITLVNPALCQMLGWREDELLGKDAHLLFHHHAKDGSLLAGETCPIMQAIERGENYQSEEQCYLHKDGTPIPVSILSTPIVREGEVAGAVVAFQDISWRKKAEQQLIRFNETLSQRVAEEVARNMEHERMLIQQSRLAAMGEMVGNIAHQWRQPLNALGLLLANLKDAYDFGELDDETMDRSVDTGNRLIQKMSSTIDDFRNFFKPNKEKLAFRLEDAVRDTLELIGPSLRSHAIEVSVEGDSGGPIFGYPNEFSQVLLNVLGNARDAILERHAQPGRIGIVLGHDERNAWACIRDNGGGIPADVLPRVFEPYFSTKEKGTGIGLYMSKTIMEEHMGGTIEAANAEDGAVFTLRCPRIAKTGDA